MPDSSSLQRAALIRSRRQELGISSRDLARRLGLTDASLAALEDGSTENLSFSLLLDLASLLHLPVKALLGTSSPALATLDSLAVSWSTSTLLAPGLAVLRSWVELDEHLSLVAAPSSGRDSLAARGVPEALSPALTRPTLPLLPHAVETEEIGPPFSPARQAAAFIAHSLGLPLFASLSSFTLAQRLGIPVGLAPLDKEVRSLVLAAPDACGILLNSLHHPRVQERSLAHLLVHLLQGDVVPVLADVLEDQDDDSIYHCVGSTASACNLAQLTARFLTSPEAELEAEQSWADQRDLEAAGGSTRPYFRSYALLPSLGARAPWEDDRPVHPQPLRRLLGVHHDDLTLPAGSGETAWPFSLAERYVAVVARGLTPPHRLPELGLTSLNSSLAHEAALAAARYEAVQSQLERHYGP